MGTYIEKLHAKSIAKYQELNIEFGEKFNFIVGANGCGKTTLLKTMALIFNPGRANSFRYGDDCEIWIDYVNGEVKQRIGLGEGWMRQGTEYRKAQHYSWTVPCNSDGVDGTYSVNLLEENKIFLTPLFLGAYRRIEYIEIQGMKKEKGVVEKRNEYRENAILGLEGGYLPEIKQWMINRYFEIEKDWAMKYKENWNWIINNMKNISPFYEQFEFKEIKKELEPIFLLNGKECYLEELSAGFQAVLSLVFGIVDWIESVNEEESILIENATGTVIIDELDVHLHPEWQLMIRDALDKIFPKLQFIITTHSPHLIASAHSGEIIKILSGENIVNLKATNKRYSGWNTDEILEDVMDVKNLENKEWNSSISEAMQAIEKGDAKYLKTCIDNMEIIVHPNNTIVNALKIKLAELLLED
ncbi:MAG: AAA family ATPase [Lachnospiraceae bacterium]|nr:AAA family ATPase [Lachnospiraceae bacterium]